MRGKVVIVKNVEKVRSFGVEVKGLAEGKLKVTSPFW